MHKNYANNLLIELYVLPIFFAHTHTQKKRERESVKYAAIAAKCKAKNSLIELGKSINWTSGHSK